MIKFYLVNFKNKLKTSDLVLVGNLQQVTKYCDQELKESDYSSYFIECEGEQLLNIMKGLKVYSVANNI